MTNPTLVDEVEALKLVMTALQPLSAEGRQFVLKVVNERLDFSPPARSILQPKEDGNSPHAEKARTTAVTDLTTLPVKEFLRRKEPKTDVEKMACLAFYLTHSRKMAHFKTKDIEALNTEAAQSKFSNAAQTAGNAVSQHNYLASAGAGKRQITAHGEDVVNALPDRDKVATITKSHPKRGRKSKPRKKNAATKN